MLTRISHWANIIQQMQHAQSAQPYGAARANTMSQTQNAPRPPDAEIEQLRRQLHAAVDDSIAALTPGWTISELRLNVSNTGVDPRPLLRPTGKKYSIPH